MPGPRFARGRSLPAVLVALAGSVFWSACADDGPRSPAAPDAEARRDAATTVARGPDLGPAIAAQERATPGLMARGGVVGTGVAVNADGRPVIRIYLAQAGVRGLPERIEDIPVQTVVTGLISAGADETSRARPAPIGFSVGHPDITAGTIGARVTDGTDVFILSNNHVLANSNEASIGDNALQPGPTDGGTDPEDAIGQLSDFEVIAFDGSVNHMDAAIAVSSSANLDFETPADEGYGTPSATLFDLDGDGDAGRISGVDDHVGLDLQKYGRTTGHTRGQIAEVNVTVSVCYEARGPFMCAKAATFEDQISITPGSFSDGGDSGSLIVTDDAGANPVGLLFAGSATRTIANRIDRVLNRFGVSVDDGSGSGGDDGGDTNAAPTASFTSSCTDLGCDFTDESTDSDGTLSSWSWDFGDGATSTAQNPSHTYASGGTYTVTLTVTDDDGATDSASRDVAVSEATGGDYALTATGYKVRGLQKADLEWSGTDATNVDVYRDGTVIGTTANDGFYTDDIDSRGSGSYTYRVCDAGTSTCSNEDTVIF